MSIEYLIIFFTFLLCCFISVLLFFLVFFINLKSYSQEKISSYECGFHSFEDTRQKFNVRFYLVSILFLIFDLEIVFLFPWIFSIRALGLFGFLIICFFILILTVGFFYEWLKGALTWE